MIKNIEKFKEIVKRYNLFNEDKADEIAHYITDHKKDGFSVEDFSRDFTIPIDDARIFLSVVYKGVELREKHIQGNNDER